MARQGVLPPAYLTQNGRQRQAGRDGAEKRLPVSSQTLPRRPALTSYFELLHRNVKEPAPNSDWLFCVQESKAT